MQGIIYTLQVVWATSNKLGCGVYRCGNPNGFPYPNSLLLVCNYGPGWAACVLFFTIVYDIYKGGINYATGEYSCHKGSLKDFELEFSVPNCQCVCITLLWAHDLLRKCISTHACCIYCDIYRPKGSNYMVQIDKQQGWSRWQWLNELSERTKSVLFMGTGIDAILAYADCMWWLLVMPSCRQTQQRAIQ